MRARIRATDKPQTSVRTINNIPQLQCTNGYRQIGDANTEAENRCTAWRRIIFDGSGSGDIERQIAASD